MESLIEFYFGLRDLKWSGTNQPTNLPDISFHLLKKETRERTWEWEKG
jgi:hypothetical protein